jgi:diguanylate cyclase (GGDEF)-like protein
MNLKLSHKIILNFAVVLIIPMLLSVYLVSSDLAERSEREIDGQLAFTTKIVNRFFYRSLNTIQLQLNLLAETEKFRSALEKGEAGEITAVIKNWESKLNYSFIDVYSRKNSAAAAPNDSHGADSYEVFTSVHKSRFSPALAPSAGILGRVARGRNHSSIVFAGEQKAYFRCVIKTLENLRSSSGYIVAVCVPVPNDSIDAIKDITNIDVTIYDENIAVLSTRFDPAGKRTTGVKISPEAVAALEKESSYRTSEKFLSEHTMNVYSKILDQDKSFRGYMCVIVPRELFAMASMYVINNLYIIMAISLLLATMSGYLLSSNIAAPLKEFAKIAHITSEGDFKQKVNIERSDEIGELATAFNKMGGKLDRYNESLKRKMFEVTTLYEVSQSMNFLNNKDQLLTIILTKMIDALNAEKGSIMLYNAEECLISCEMAVGYPGKFERRVKFAPGEGKAGQAFSTGNTIISNDIQSDSSFVRTQSTQTTDNVTRNMMCVPMKTKDEAIGVINIVNKKGGEGFNDDDKALAASLCTQAAMTIENARLYELSITDGMTRLYIHRFFQIRLDEEIKRSRRYSAPLSLVMTDIDHFKKFNDTYGHQVGDMVLIKVADIIRETIRNEVDIPCRYGGEEFAIIAPQTGLEDAKRMAERIRSAVENAELAGPNGKSLKITLSLGISTYPVNSTEKKDLILKADSAMYHSKENGRNMATHFSEVPEAESEGGPPARK